MGWLVYDVFPLQGAIRRFSSYSKDKGTLLGSKQATGGGGLGCVW